MRCLYVRLFATLACLAAAGCTSTIDLRGSQITPQNLAEIEPGRFTRSDVIALLGTPSTTSEFGDDSWYYISAKMESWAFLKPEEIDRQVVVIQFDKSGTVKEVRRLGLDDGRQVDIATNETPTAGKDMTVLEQLMGNVGKFTPIKGKSSSSTGYPGGGP